MNKEIKDRLDKLENELKESKIEIHSLKSSVSLTIELGNYFLVLQGNN
jgi:hypothetical protein